MASVELAAREQAHQLAGEEVLGLVGPSSFMEEGFSSFKMASVFLAIRRPLGLAVRQQQVAAPGGNGSSLGEDIFIRSGGSVTFQINGTLTIPNPIEGGGLLSEVTGPGVLMSGTGIVNLNGTNTYLGDTLIQSGILNLNGSVLGDLNIESSGTLSGNATVNGSIYNSGTISPGNSIGEVFTTDLYLYSTSVYNVEVNSAGDSDEIIASGSAQVDGGVVVIPDDINFTTPLTYTIISTNSGVTGRFSSLTSSRPFSHEFDLQPSDRPAHLLASGSHRSYWQRLQRCQLLRHPSSNSRIRCSRLFTTPCLL